MKLNSIKDTIVDVFNQLSKIENKKGRFFPSRAFSKSAKDVSEADDYEISGSRIILSNKFGNIVLGQSSSEIFIDVIEHGESSRLNSESVYLIDDPLESDLINVSGIGEVKLNELFDAGIKSASVLNSLELNIGDKIPGTNITYSQTIDTGLKFYLATGNERITRQLAYEYLTNFKNFLIDNNVVNFEMYPVGSYRRHKPTVGDIDIILVSKENETISDNVFEVVSKWLDSILVYGETKIAGIKGKTQVDVRLIDRKYLGAHILHGTGSQEFNIKMRSLAKYKGLKLNEYCITDENGDEIYFNKEIEIFRYLGVPYVAPWNR